MTSTLPANETNPYAAPGADVRDLPAARGTGFYVVSSRKFFLLFLLTLGAYYYYWVYRQWADIKRNRGGTLWPIPRAIFSIFFTHPLTREMDARLTERAPQYAWSPGAIATTVVILLMVNNVFDRMSWRDIGTPLTHWLSLVAVLPWAFAVHAMQRAANVASGDPEGQHNTRLTGANIAWMMVGSLIWLLSFIGLLLPEAQA